MNREFHFLNHLAQTGFIFHVVSRLLLILILMPVTDVVDDDDDDDGGGGVVVVADVAHPQTVVNVASQRHYVEGCGWLSNNYCFSFIA